ncbi:MAG: hypothetical protein IJN32_02290 [Thermoguttaceae bacterium]|nr:hypothetical protein [Thermoguttaceae bacterium]
MTQRSALSFFVRPLRSRASTLGVGVLFATLASPLFASDASTQTPLSPTLPTAQTSDAPPTSEPPRFVLTRLDVVYVGVVRDRGDVLSIERLDGGSVSVSKLDVQFIGGGRDDLFAFKKSRTRLEDVGETLRLADWANRRQLAPQAIALLETKLAEPLSDGERRAVAAKLEELRQIEKWRASAARTVAARQNGSAGSTRTPNAAASPSVSPEVAEIEGWAKEVPVSAFERFARRAQPILQKRCATAGCHDGSNPNSAFRVRPKAVGAQARLALYFNLRETFDFIDFNDPARSPILNHPAVADAWGKRVYPFGEDRNSAKDCQTFVSWIESLNDGKLGRYVHRPSRVRDASAATLRPNAVSRYDVVETPNGYSASPSGNLSTPTNPNPFAGLFDASTPPASPTVPNSPTNAATAPDEFVLRSGTPREARQYLPNPADDPNSPENVLKRGGYAPKRQYRDEYDPAIFNAAAPDAPARY